MMNQPEPSLSSHFGKPALYQNGLKKQLAHHSPIEITESFFNYTRTPLTVVKRNGLIIPLTPEPVMGFDEKLSIRVDFNIRNATVAQIKKQLTLLDEQDDEALHLLRTALENSVISPMAYGVKITLEYPLSLMELKKYGGSVYYGELDLVVSLDPPTTVIPHPYSERGRRANIATAVMPEGSTDMFGYSVFVVDNHGQYGPRYLNIGGKVYRVSPVRDPIQNDGIYITSSRPVDGDLFEPGVEVLHYSFEGAEESVGLYKTFDEALNLGDLNTARKETLAKMEQDNLVLQRDLNLTKSKHAAEQAEQDRRMKDMVAFHEREKFEMTQKQAEIEAAAKKRELLEEQRRAEMKDYYEKRSLERKDSSEVVKVLPAIIVGIGAAVAVLLKIFK